MFNITVINLKKLVKNLILILIIIVLIFFLLKPSKNLLKKCSGFINEKCDYIIGLELSLSNYEKINLEKGIEKILSSELVAMSAINEVEEVNSSVLVEETPNLNKPQENKVEEVNTPNTDVTKEIDYKNLNTKVLAEKNLKETYNAEYNGGKSANKVYLENILETNKSWDVRPKNPLKRLVGEFGKFKDKAEEILQINAKTRPAKIILAIVGAFTVVTGVYFIYQNRKQVNSQKPLDKVA